MGMRGLLQLAQRKSHFYRWRLRYWWLDTRDGERAHWVGVCISAIVCIVQLVRMFAQGVTPDAPVRSVYWWVVQLIIAVVAAVVSYAMRPKPTVPGAQKSESPSTEDGQFVKHHFGTCWVDNEFILAWKPMGTVPIKTKGGKK